MNANLIQSILTDLCKSFRGKIDDQYQLVAQINITDLDQSWAVVIQPGKKMSLQNRPHDQAMYFFRVEAETLRKIYAGELTRHLSGLFRAHGAGPVETGRAYELASHCGDNDTCRRILWKAVRRAPGRRGKPARP